MAVLPNGIETLEVGVTGWREVCNANFTKIVTLEEMGVLAVDIGFNDDSVGVVFKDRTTGGVQRIYVDNGELLVESA